nr:methyltransferase domain-containing protein [Candidatus Sigynarchaeota archaeon]
MLDIDKFLAASVKDLEGISWYEIVSKLGLLSFNAQGNKPMELISTIAHITEKSTVLVVGCGAGGTTMHLAEVTGAEVHGIDISPESIAIAKELGSKSSARDKLHFQIGDARDLSFPPNTFDAVVTEYMAFFLQPDTFCNFLLALKPGGSIAMAELMKDPNVDAKANARILATEETYSELLGYKFHIPLSSEYVDWLTRAGFKQVNIETKISPPSFRERLDSVGGWKNLFKIIKVTLKLMRASKDLRKKFMQMGRVKRVISQQRSTAKYIFQAILVGQRPLS